MKDKVIMVTGASSGIGEAIARHFCKKSAIVIGVARNESKLSIMAQQLGEHFIYFLTDLGKLENIQKVFDSCKEKGLKLDGLVHCAGITLNLPLRGNTIQQTQQIMNINFGAFVEMVRLVTSKRYSNNGASIVALSSMAAYAGQRGGSLYAASKAAISLFVKSAAMELVSREIRINAIAPVVVETQMYYQTMDEIPGFDQRTLALQPLGLIPPKSVAELAEFLMTEKSHYITGTVVPINAGYIF